MSLFSINNLKYIHQQINNKNVLGIEVGTALLILKIRAAYIQYIANKYYGWFRNRIRDP